MYFTLITWKIHRTIINNGMDNFNTQIFCYPQKNEKQKEQIHTKYLCFHRWRGFWLTEMTSESWLIWWVIIATGSTWWIYLRWFRSHFHLHKVSELTTSTDWTQKKSCSYSRSSVWRSYLRSLADMLCISKPSQKATEGSPPKTWRNRRHRYGVQPGPARTRWQEVHGVHFVCLLQPQPKMSSTAVLRDVPRQIPRVVKKRDGLVGCVWLPVQAIIF